MSSVPQVFVVDNEHAIASSLAAVLRLHGYSTTTFTSPVEALDAARSRPPSLLISDVVMRGLSGVDLAIQIKAQYPECKILLFSGQAATMDLLEDARSHGHDFQLLQKPIHPSEILSRIGELVTVHRGAGSETSASQLRLEADAAEKRGQLLLKDSLSTRDALRYERFSRDAVSLLVGAARLRSHADELEKDGPSGPE